MGLVITMIDGGVNIENTDSAVIESYPTKTTSLVYSNGTITSRSQLSAKILINNVSQVDSITDNRTNGVGVIAVPANVKALWVVLNPFFLN